jgi:hypothetical protein
MMAERFNRLMDAVCQSLKFNVFGTNYDTAVMLVMLMQSNKIFSIR